MIRFAFILALSLASVAFKAAWGQDVNGWVGKRVITKLGVSLRVGSDRVDEHRMYHTYQVRRAESGWLWLESPKRAEVKGWARPDDVVLLENAIDYYTEVVAATPTNSQAYYLRGAHWLYDRNEPDIAIGDFNEAIRLKPSYSAAWANRGSAWYAKRNYDNAIADYTEAIRLDPTDFISYGNRWGRSGNPSQF